MADRPLELVVLPVQEAARRNSCQHSNCQAEIPLPHANYYKTLRSCECRSQGDRSNYRRRC